MASNLTAMASNLIAMASNLIAMGDGLQPNCDGLQPNSDCLHPIRSIPLVELNGEGLVCGEDLGVLLQLPRRSANPGP